MRFALGAAVSLLLAAMFETPVPAPTATVVRGVVFDSLALRGLEGATVQLMTLGTPSTVRNTKSDGRGHFEFADVPLGSYVLGFFHPKLDSLGWTGETLRIDVRVDQPVETQLSIPSERTIVRTICGASFATEEAGLLLGYVRGANDSRPREGATLLLRWADIVIEKGAVKREVLSATATTKSDGQFVVCGVPLAVPILLQASVGADSSGRFEITLPGALVHRDVYVAPVARVRVESGDSMPDAERLRGTGRVRGKVAGANQRAIGDAHVTVWGTGVETTTNPDGEFALTSLPTGTHTLEVRALGFSPAQVVIDIKDAQASADVELAPIGVTLDTIRVTAQRAYTSQRILDIERRQRSGMGQVLLAEDIDKRNPFRMSDLLRTMRGVRMVPGPFFDDVVLMRDKLGNGYCEPQFIVDNMRVAIGPNFPIDVMVPMRDVVAVEVYSTIVPADFFSSNNCGVVAITTGRWRRLPNR